MAFEGCARPRHREGANGRALVHGRFADAVRQWMRRARVAGFSKHRRASGQRPPAVRRSRMSMPNPAPAASTTAATTRIQQHRRYLMCRPEHFTVTYTINPWMEPANPTDTALAVRQWQVLYETYLALGHEVELIDPIPGLPDMVYTANGGFVIGGVAYGAKFRFQERVPEGPAFMDWFSDNGFDVVDPV